MQSARDSSNACSLIHHPRSARWPRRTPTRSRKATSTDTQPGGPMKRIVTTLITTFSLVSAVAHAQFGSGVVYDPTQSAHAITQIENEGRSLENQVQQIENGQQIFTNTVKIAAT